MPEVRTHQGRRVFYFMKKYTFKTKIEIKSFYAKDLFEAKKMAFNYFKTNLIDLV